MNYFQQGDVLLKPAEFPKDLNQLKSNVLQEGEHTGHAHRLFPEDAADYQLFEEPKTKVKYLRLVKSVPLRHEEHKEIKVPAGDYVINIVREYDHFDEEARAVVD